MSNRRHSEQNEHLRVSTGPHSSIVLFWSMSQFSYLKITEFSYKSTLLDGQFPFITPSVELFFGYDAILSHSGIIIACRKCEGD